VPGCFGKLPFWPEYLQENVSYPSSRALVDWIHEGRAESGLFSLGDGAGEPEPPQETSSLRLLYGRPGSMELVAGVIRPSSDQGGLRTFPFLVFTHLPRRQFGRHYGLLPLALAPVWDALDEAWDGLASVASRDAFKEMVASLRLPPPVAVREARADYRSRQRQQPGGLSREGGGALVERLACSMPQVLDGVRSGTLRVELPVAKDLGVACLDTSFWIDLINSQFRFRRVEPAVFLDEGPVQPDRKVFLTLSPLVQGAGTHPGRPRHLRRQVSTCVRRCARTPPC
jgi:hypothetical protein